MATSGWYRSKPISFKLEKEDTKQIEIKGFLFSEYLLPVGLFIALIYFGLYFKFQHNSLILATALIVVFGYICYFHSFGRNQYLRLLER